MRMLWSVTEDSSLGGGVASAAGFASGSFLDSPSGACAVAPSTPAKISNMAAATSPPNFFMVLPPGRTWNFDFAILSHSSIQPVSPLATAILHSQRRRAIRQPSAARLAAKRCRWLYRGISSCPSLGILDQHCVGRFRAAGEGQSAIWGPVKPENLVRGEMRHRLGRAARYGLLPDITHPIHAVNVTGCSCHRCLPSRQSENKLVEVASAAQKYGENAGRLAGEGALRLWFQGLGKRPRRGFYENSEFRSLSPVWPFWRPSCFRLAISEPRMRPNPSMTSRRNIILFPPTIRWQSSTRRVDLRVTSRSLSRKRSPTIF